VTIALRLAERRIETVVLDIEGTTTPIGFVYDILLPYARAHLREYLCAPERAAVVAAIARRLRAERQAESERDEPPPWREDTRDQLLESTAAYAEWLMNRDRKSPGLKELQGKIWERGYDDGTLRGEVFPDVPAALERWQRSGFDVAIYSSGSVLAQRLLFSTTTDGDLTRFVRAFFDTAVGAKQSPDSYRRIAMDLGCAPSHMLFVSDSAPELDAARAAGWHVAMCIRPGNPEQARADDVPVIANFDEIIA